jgi:DNA-binding transcriptional ArsR family regulator
MIGKIPMIKKPPIEEEYLLSDLETLKVLSDPLRMQILEQIGLFNDRGQAAAVKQLAETLSIPATKLYYHVNLLEEHDLIRVVETRLVSGILEKRYQIRARKIRVDLDLEHTENGAAEDPLGMLLDSVSAVLEKTVDNLARSYRSLLKNSEAEQAKHMLEESSLEIQQAVLQISDARAREFSSRLRELVAEFKSRPRRGEALQTFNLTVVFHPAYHLSGGHKETQHGDAVH